jgi:hypothetical protein
VQTIVRLSVAVLIQQQISCADSCSSLLCCVVAEQQEEEAKVRGDATPAGRSSSNSSRSLTAAAPCLQLHVGPVTILDGLGAVAGSNGGQDRCLLTLLLLRACAQAYL